VARLAGLQGYSVAVNYRSNHEAARRVVGSIESAGGRAVAVEADVSVEHEVVRLFERLDELGPLQGLVNNAGILEQQTTILGINQARLQRIFATNVFGPFLCCREAVRRMTQGGAIVNISSMASRLGSAGEYVDYAASKAAIDTLTLGLAKEVAGQGIRVNCVRPGMVYTDIHADGGEPGRVDRLAATVPMGRGGQAEEIASAVLWLLSSEASYTTGAILDVTGGR
jgi:NAD(P)-dependent dehydrogenase (short-subunit alcohol dehydrogenase family)